MNVPDIKEIRTEGFDSICLGSIAISFTLGIFFFGGNSAIFLLLASFFLFSISTFVILKFVSGKALTWSKVHTFFLLYTLFLFSNIFTSVFPENSINMVWLFLALPMTLMVCGNLTDDGWKKMIFFLSLAIILSAIWGLSEFLWTGKRATGPVIDPNSWVSVFNIFYFIILSYFLSSQGSLSKPALLLLLLISTAIFSAYSRVGNLNFALALVFVLGISFTVKTLRVRLALVVLSVCISYSAVNLVTNMEDATSNSEGYTLDTESSGWAQRFAQWESGIEQYRDHPVLGSGLGTFRLLYPAYRTQGDLNTAGNYVHNDYVQLLAETGPVSIVFLALFILFLLSSLWRHLKSLFSKKNTEAIEAIVLIVAMGTVCLHALMNFTFYNLPNQILLALALARLLTIEGRLYTYQTTINAPKATGVGVILFYLYIVLINALDFVSFDLVYGGGHVSIDQNVPGTKLGLYDIVSRIVKVRPNVSGNRFAMATLYRTSFDEQPGNAVDARRSLSIVTALEYQRGLELNPYHYQIRTFFADFLKQNPVLMSLPEIYQTPESLLREGLEIAPCYIERYVNLASYLREIGRDDEAYQLLVEEALPWHGLRYHNYETYQLLMYRDILHGAKKRNDTMVLQRLLKLL